MRTFINMVKDKIARYRELATVPVERKPLPRWAYYLDIGCDLAVIAYISVQLFS